MSLIPYTIMTLILMSLEFESWELEKKKIRTIIRVFSFEGCGLTKFLVLKSMTEKTCSSILDHVLPSFQRKFDGGLTICHIYTM